MNRDVHPVLSSNGPPQTINWYLRIQGDCVEVRQHLNYSKVPAEDARGMVGQFSRSARMRMLRTVAKIDWPTVGDSVFITLTYPDQVGTTTYKQRGQHRYLFLRYLEKHTRRQLPVLWRVEWKPRLSGDFVGRVMPHMHLLIGGLRYVNQCTVRKWWRTIVHVNGPLCTDVQRLEASVGAALYVSKYVAKNPSLDIGAYLNNHDAVGRHWGMVRKHLFPWAPLEVLREITDVQAEDLRRLVDLTLPHYNPETGKGFTVLGELFRSIVAAKCKSWD